MPSHTAPASHTGHTGKCTAGGLTPSSPCDQRHQLIERRVFGTGEQIRAARGRGHRRAQPQAGHQIVDVGEVIEDLAAPEHRKTSAGDAAKHLQEARVAGPIDANRPRDHDVEPAAAAEFRGEPLGVELGALIDVAGRERRVLVCRRRLDVAVDAAGAAVHHAPDAGGARRLEHVAGAFDVHAAVRAVALPRLPIGRGDVVDQLAAGDGTLDARRIRQVADPDVDALALQRRRAFDAARADQRGHRIAGPRQRAGEVRAGEARCAGDENVHARAAPA